MAGVPPPTRALPYSWCAPTTPPSPHPTPLRRRMAGRTTRRTRTSPSSCAPSCSSRRRRPRPPSLRRCSSECRAPAERVSPFLHFVSFVFRIYSTLLTGVPLRAESRRSRRRGRARAGGRPRRRRRGDLRLERERRARQAHSHLPHLQPSASPSLSLGKAVTERHFTGEARLVESS